MNRELQLVRAVALEADGFYEQSAAFGRRAAVCFPEKQKSQMKNLESIANSALKVADVFDYIKKQVGKDSGKRPTWRSDGFGEALLDHLESDVRKRVDNLPAGLKATDPAERQRVQLQLIREFIHQLVAQYEFCRGNH